MLSVKFEKNYLVVLDPVQLKHLERMSFTGSKTCREFGKSIKKTLGMPTSVFAEENKGTKIEIQISSSTGQAILNMLKEASKSKYRYEQYPMMAKHAQALLPLFEQAKQNQKQRSSVELVEE